MDVWPKGPSGKLLKKVFPKTNPAQVFWPVSEMPYFDATAGTLMTVWHPMGQPVQALPRTVCRQPFSPRKKAALLVR
jgi:hypothetical protein